jgi:4-alpha-glucanotransferase
VRELRDRWELPGMRVLHFAFSEGAASPHLPIWYPRNAVVYTGTHDNDTSVGWYEKASEVEREELHRFEGTSVDRVHLDLARIAYASVADLAVVPMQDVLGLGSRARMNVPGKAEGNWGWKLVDGQADEQAARRMHQLAETFGRLPGQKQAIDD